PVASLSTCPYTPDNAHQTHFAVVPYLSTQSDFDMEEIAFWTSYEVVWNNPSYHGYERCLAVGQCRGVAWQINQFGYAAELLPDTHPMKAHFREALKNTAEYWWTDRHAPGKPMHNPFGIWAGRVRYGALDGGYRAIPPWQNHYLAPVLHLLV